ncbi:hypothetical protein D3C81_1881110 [compost metagenome]
MAFAAAVGPLGRTAQHCVHPGDDLFGDKRLRHIIVGTAVKSSQPVFYAVPGGEHDDGAAADFTDLPQQFKAVHIRQHDVEQYKGRRRCLENFKCGYAVGGMGHLEAGFFQIGAQHAGNRCLIFNNQNGFHGKQASFSGHFTTEQRAAL